MKRPSRNTFVGRLLCISKTDLVLGGLPSSIYSEDSILITITCTQILDNGLVVANGNQLQLRWICMKGRHCVSRTSSCKVLVTRTE